MLKCGLSSDSQHSICTMRKGNCIPGLSSACRRCGVEENRLEVLQEKLWPKEQIMEPQNGLGRKGPRGSSISTPALGHLSGFTLKTMDMLHVVSEWECLLLEQEHPGMQQRGFSIGMIGIERGLMFNTVRKARMEHVEFGFSVIKENKQ